MSSFRYRKLRADTFDPLELEEGDTRFKAPKTVEFTRRIDNVLYVAGRGNEKNPDIMFVAPCLYEEESAQGFEMAGGREMKDEAVYLKGPSGSILRDLCGRAGIDLDKEFYTAVCRWPLPVNARAKPKNGHYAWGMPALMHDIRRLRPKIMVCMGKPVFDLFYPVKLKLQEIEGGFFEWTDPEDPTLTVLLFPTEEPYRLVHKPEIFEHMYVNFEEIQQTREGLKFRGECVTDDHEKRMRVIDDLPALRRLVDDIIEANAPYVAFDCEWGGRDHHTGQLRSTQLAWTYSDSAYIRFCKPAKAPGELMPYTFGGTYTKAGAELRRLRDYYGKPFLAGHQAAADMPWWSEVLGCDVRGFVVFDTLYAQQCADEAADVKLERLGMMYGRLGRYDIPLQLEKKKLKLDKNEGYARLSDENIIPYGCRDVLATWRSVAPIKRRLTKQGLRLWDYWHNECRPFVTDIFASFTIQGLRVDRTALTETRAVLAWAVKRMEAKFIKDITADSTAHLRATVKANLDDAVDATKADDDITDALSLLTSEPAAGIELLKGLVKVEAIEDLLTAWKFCEIAPSFNLRAGDQMRLWLFGVKKFTPLKTTGKPAIDWKKVMEWPEERRKAVTPAADKSVLMVYAGDPRVAQLLELNMTGNLVKAFLKPDEVDPETGDLVKENGLHAWLCDDNKIRGQWSLTETARPRSWNPNTLNLPSFVNDRIKEAVKKTCVAAAEIGELPEEFSKYATEYVLAVRSHITASPGGILVETDFKTAEIFAKAFLAGDEDLLRVLTIDDEQFVMVKDKDGNPTPMRVAYAPDYGIAEENQDPKLLNALPLEQVEINKFAKGLGLKAPESEEEYKDWVGGLQAPEGELWTYAGRIGASFFVCRVKPLGPDAWMKDREGKVLRPKHDLHWALAEMVYKRPRETLSKKMARDAVGKTGNFSCISLTSAIETSVGAVSLTDTKKNLHRVYDGTEFVQHDGLVYQGIHPTIVYHGLTATPNHIVYLADGNPCFFGIAALRGLALSTGSKAPPPSAEAGAPEAAVSNADARESRGILRDLPVQALRGGSEEVAPQPGDWEGAGVCLPARERVHAGKSHGPDRQGARGPLPLHEATLREVDSRQLVQLQGAWDTGAVQERPRVHPVGSVEVAGHGLSWSGLRQDRQRRTLQSGEPETGRPAHKPGEHTHLDPELWGEHARVPDQKPDLPSSPEDCAEPVRIRYDRGGHTDLLQQRGALPHEGLHREAQQPGEGEELLGESSDSEVHSDARARSDTAGPVRGKHTAALGGLVSERGQCNRGVRVQAILPGEPVVPDRRTILPQAAARKEVGGPGHPDTSASAGVKAQHVESSARLDGGESDTGRERVACADADGSRSLGEGDPEPLPADSLAQLAAAGFPHTYEHVYDLLNCGPRRRFVANGVLVSNCAYGATEGAVERKIKVETGVEPEPGTGRAILDALATKYPVSEAWLQERETFVETGTLQAFSGRIRHFHSHNAELVSDRIFEDGLNPLKRESRNFECQHFVGSIAARAAIKLDQHYKQTGMKARVIALLYDSIVTDCPMEERHVVAELHQRYMSDETFEVHHGRKAFLDIDVEFNPGWSRRPNTADMAKYADPAWNVMPQAEADKLLALHVTSPTDRKAQAALDAVRRVA